MSVMNQWGVPARATPPVTKGAPTLTAPTEGSLFLSAVDRMCPDGAVLRVDVHTPEGDGVIGGFVAASAPDGQTLVVVGQHQEGVGLSLQIHSFVDGNRVETAFGRNGLISIAAPRPETPCLGD